VISSIPSVQGFIDHGAIKHKAAAIRRIARYFHTYCRGARESGSFVEEGYINTCSVLKSDIFLIYILCVAFRLTRTIVDLLNFRS